MYFCILFTFTPVIYTCKCISHILLITADVLQMCQKSNLKCVSTNSGQISVYLPDMTVTYKLHESTVWARKRSAAA